MNLTDMKDAELNSLIQKSLEQIRAGGHEVEVAKATLGVLSDEKRFRTAIAMNRSSSRWSKLTLLAIVLVGVLQAAAILYLGYQMPLPADDDGGTCDQQEYSASL